MFFDSTIYILFLVLTVLVFWRIGFRQQNYFLVFASYFFYGWWDWRFLGLMAASTCFDFVVAKMIEVTENTAKRRILLVVSLGVNLSVLGFFKYFNFFVDSFIEVAHIIGFQSIPEQVWDIVLPPAVSFYTFQEVAYVVDVYKRRLPAARSLVEYALFVSLFPHLIAGPIQKPSHLLPQIQHPRIWSPSKAFDGVLLILEGMFRKVVIADNCALIANAAFGGKLGEPSLAVTLIGTYAFAFQIYGDFSGYSSIARGSAQLLGFHFMVNFRQPYFAQSLQDFWRRWHISLSGWLRDYLYIPLGGNRNGGARTYWNLLVTMLLGGLWHGANWTFVVWGAIHGFGLAVERFFVRGERALDSERFLPKWIRRAVVFNVVCLAWIFFRTPSVSESFVQIAAFADLRWDALHTLAVQFLGMFVIAITIVDAHLDKAQTEYLFADKSTVVRLATAMLYCILISLFGANEVNAFIYFRF